MFWIFNKDRSVDPKAIPMYDNISREELSRPHAHAFLGKLLVCPKDFAHITNWIFRPKPRLYGRSFHNNPHSI